MAAMKIGICLPYMKRDYDRAAILEWCRRIDAGPFSSLSTGERITGYTYEMRILLAAAAAVTERVRIVPSLYVLPMHSAVWAAKEIATLDVLSEGRVTVTVGVGGREIDYRAVGASFAKRNQKMDEQIAVMRAIWAGEPPCEGADAVGPTPFQPGGPPILAGSMGPKSIRRVSKWADGLYGFSMNGEARDTARVKERGERAWEESARAAKPYFAGGFWLSLAENSEAQLKEYVFRYLEVFGEKMARAAADAMTRHTPEAVREAIDGLEAIGCDEIFLVPATADLRELDAIEELLAKR